MRGRHPSRWNEYRETATRRFPDRLYATIEPVGGTFLINIATYRKMNEPDAVVLLYDRDTRTIGVRPSSLDVPHAIAVYARHEKYDRVWRSKKFLRTNGIEIAKRIIFPRAQIDDTGVLILDLREAIAAADRKKKRDK